MKLRLAMQLKITKRHFEFEFHWKFEAGAVAEPRDKVIQSITMPR